MILRHLASRNRDGLRLIDLVDALQLEQPTVHRMLKSLVAESLVMQDPQNKRYFLGRSMYELGLAASQRFDFRSLCSPILSNLARQTGDTVFLTSRSGDESVCLARHEGTSPVKVFTLALGDRRPLGAGASSMALLSAYPLAEIRQIIFSNAERLAEFGEPEPEDLFRRVEKAKRLGYSVRDLPHFEGIRAIGVPVFDFEAQPIAAISISTLTARLTGHGFDERLHLLREHADQIRKLTEPTSGG
ncbi:transcriptional regulator, IclR family [Pseudacidovorax sp. RU35E]|nr:transcriptional regulator, IclR family [Pseudacidovorax sp. RU35E]